MDTTVKMVDIDFIPEPPRVRTKQEEGFFSSGCKIGVLMFVGSMLLIGGTILGIVLTYSK